MVKTTHVSSLTPYIFLIWLKNPVNRQKWGLKIYFNNSETSGLK